MVSTTLVELLVTQVMRSSDLYQVLFYLIYLT